jgi:hypothetical protein
MAIIQQHPSTAQDASAPACPWWCRETHTVDPEWVDEPITHIGVISTRWLTLIGYDFAEVRTQVEKFGDDPAKVVQHFIDAEGQVKASLDLTVDDADGLVTDLNAAALVASMKAGAR